MEAFSPAYGPRSIVLSGAGPLARSKQEGVKDVASNENRIGYYCAGRKLRRTCGCDYRKGSSSEAAGETSTRTGRGHTIAAPHGHRQERQDFQGRVDEV